MIKTNMYHLIKREEDGDILIAIAKECIMGTTMFDATIEEIIKTSQHWSSIVKGSRVTYFKKRIIASDENIQVLKEQAMLEIL